MKASGQLHAPAALLPGKETGYPLDRRLGGPQTGLGAMVKRKISLPLPGVTVLCELSQLPNNILNKWLLKLDKMVTFLLFNNREYSPEYKITHNEYKTEASKHNQLNGTLPNQLSLLHTRVDTSSSYKCLPKGNIYAENKDIRCLCMSYRIK
jgi:hypothetical protein